TPGAADFCLLSRPAYEALRRMPERHRFLRGMLGWIGFRRTYVEFRAPARAGGRSKYSVRKMIGLAGDAIFSFSFVPVRAIAIFGTGVCLVGMGYLGGEVAWRLATARFVGGTGIVVGLMMVLCGASVAATGLIGEYVVRTLDQVKGRPLYILKQQPDMGHSDQRKPA
ncbi:MAG: glycosyltransferase, partial [candidate division KSB1 bacterium]|nr:glycosyltransferase [candidate division KSB1 bacterium]